MDKQREEMISGKEALIAWDKGELVQFQDVTDVWHDAHKGLTLDTFNRYKFRLKPKTITINGVELAPPKHIGFESDFGLLIHFENHEQRQKFKEALRSVFKT